jgi:hypothetical protein
MDGWATLATRAHAASSFAELREAGEGFGRVLGTDAARAMILAVGALTGRTLGEVAARVRALPGYGLVNAQWRRSEAPPLTPEGGEMSGTGHFHRFAASRCPTADTCWPARLPGRQSADSELNVGSGLQCREAVKKHGV